MNAILDLAQLERTTLSPRLSDDSRRGPLCAPASRLARLDPAADEEAMLPMPMLGLTPADIERLQALSAAVADARDAMQLAEVTLTRATHEAKRLPELERRAGGLAAAAIRGGGDAKAAAKAIAADIDDARTAGSAITQLTHERDASANAFVQARGALHMAATAAIRQACLRASKRYGELALELTRCVAAVHAGILALPSHQQTDLTVGWYAHMLGGLSLPAMPMQLRVDHDGVTELNFRDSLLLNEHPRLTCHQSAALGRLQAQLREALAPSGIDPKRLLA